MMAESVAFKLVAFRSCVFHITVALGCGSYSVACDVVVMVASAALISSASAKNQTTSIFPSEELLRAEQREPDYPYTDLIVLLAFYARYPAYLTGTTSTRPMLSPTHTFVPERTAVPSVTCSLGS
jgi:hypothetical protein